MDTTKSACILTFGKFAGCAIETVENNYLHWLAGCAGAYEDDRGPRGWLKKEGGHIIAAAKAEIERRHAERAERRKAKKRAAYAAAAAARRATAAVPVSASGGGLGSGEGGQGAHAERTREATDGSAGVLYSVVE